MKSNDLLSSIQVSYATLAIMTREIVVINMWAGQLLCEVFNWILKRVIKQERPVGASSSLATKSHLK